ncbi:MAG TPA: folate-binding protein [Halieaceae bacterium]|nr:folate-binding protein [Halieaceae bacterium]
MNWNDFLQEYHFDQAAAESDCSLAALGSLGLIRVQGEDARDFLQGQLTNDINSVTSEQAQLSAWCTPKGRMLALLLIFQHDGALYLLLPRERIQAVLKRLRMFVLRSKVTLDDVSDELPAIGLGGNCVTELFDDLPAGIFASQQSSGLTVIRFPGTQPRVMIIGEAAPLAAFWQQAANLATPVNDHWWPLQNIRAGIPSVHDATAESFIPQMVNLDLLNGISFTKGCYTGQEVVARMKYLGKLKRRMYLAGFESAEPPQPGDKLFSPHSKSAQGAGEIVDVHPAPQGGWKALVVAEISSAEAGDVHLKDAGGPRLTLTAPPYGLAAKE